MKNLIALIVLSLASFARGDNLTDLSGWPRNKLPVAAEWALGHDLAWCVQQVQAGSHLLPHAKMVVKKLLNVPKQATGLSMFATEFKYVSDNKLPLILRHQSNVPLDITENRGSYPDNTAAEWRFHPDTGELDSKPTADPLAPVSYWTALGTDWSNSLYINGGVDASNNPILGMKSLCPDPAWIGLWDNNEAGYPNVKEYSTVSSPTSRAWFDRTKMGQTSLTMQAKVDVLGYDSDPFEFWPEFFLLRKAQYQSLWLSFKEQGWSGKELYTAAYSAPAWAGYWPPNMPPAVGYAPEAICYDGSGKSCYPGENGPINLIADEWPQRIAENKQAWEYLEGTNPKAFRIVFVSIQPKAATGGTTPPADWHGSVTPDMFRAFCEWLAWLARPEDGGPVLLQHWIGSSTQPSAPFYGGYTHGQYSAAPALACTSICADERREYWINGKPVEVTVDNPNVRAVAVKAGSNCLVYAWSPYVLEGTLAVTVDGVSAQTEVPSQSGKYLIVQTTPDPEPEPPPTGTVEIDKALLQDILNKLQRVLDGDPDGTP